MATPHAPQITILKEVYPILEKLIKSGKSEHRLVERARLIIQMGEGQADLQIAKQCGVNSKTVKKWRARWRAGEEKLATVVASDQPAHERATDLQAQVLKLLQDQARPGVAMTYTAEQYCRILEVGLEEPAHSGRPITSWTARELADEVNKRGICQKISVSQVGRFLKRSGSQAASSEVLVKSTS